MEASWKIDKDILAKWEELVAANSDKELPRSRREKNVQRHGINLSEQTIWHALVGCQVTTQQKSGPDKPVSRFLDSKSPALDVLKCRNAPSLRRLLERELTKAGLRFAPKISSNLDRILHNLEAGEWKVLINQLKTLDQHTTIQKERSVVLYLQAGGYPGLGQKQSRNFIQWLGLSRYEVPLDSRVLRKLRELGANFVPSGPALADEAVYLFVQSCLQDIALAIGVYPCELDACIFASYD